MYVIGKNENVYNKYKFSSESNQQCRQLYEKTFDVSWNVTEVHFFFQSRNNITTSLINPNYTKNIVTSLILENPTSRKPKSHSLGFENHFFRIVETSSDFLKINFIFGIILTVIFRRVTTIFLIIKSNSQNVWEIIFR